MYPQRLQIEDARQLRMRKIRIAWRTPPKDDEPPVTLHQVTRAVKRALRRKYGHPPCIRLVQKMNGTHTIVIQFTPIMSTICSGDTPFRALMSAVNESLPPK